MGFVLRLKSLLSRSIIFVVLIEIHSSSGKLKISKKNHIRGYLQGLAIQMDAETIEKVLS